MLISKLNVSRAVVKERYKQEISKKTNGISGVPEKAIMLMPGGPAEAPIRQSVFFSSDPGCQSMSRWDFFSVLQVLQQGTTLLLVLLPPLAMGTM